jgi:hypothetical protein
VFYPDGRLVGEGVKVRIDFSDDFEIQTDTNGFFDTQIALPAFRRMADRCRTGSRRMT